MKKLTFVLAAILLFQYPLFVKAVNQVNVFQITDTPYQESNNLIDGDLITYTRFGGSGGIDIWGYNLETKTTFPIIENTGEQFLSGLDGDLLVYTEINETSQTGDVHLYNMKTETDTLITPGPSTYDGGVTNGRNIIYIDGGACGLVMNYDIKSGVTQQLANSGCNAKISGHKVIWTGNGAEGLGIYGYDLASKGYFTVYIGRPDTINIYKNNVVWMTYSGSEYRIMLKNLNNGESRTLLDTTDYYVNFPAVSDRYAIWGKSLIAGQAGVEGIDLKTGELFEIYPQGSHQNTNLAPSIWRNTAVWQAWRTGNGDIYGANLETF